MNDEAVYVATCRTCGGKKMEVAGEAEANDVAANYDIWRLSRLVASKLRWCDCEAQAYEVLEVVDMTGRTFNLSINVPGAQASE